MSENSGSKRKGGKQQTPKTTKQAVRRSNDSAAAATVYGFFKLLESAVHTFGWPGACLLFGCWFLVKYATLDQKHALIDLYVLGKSTPYSVLAACGLMILVLLAQHGLYTKKQVMLQDRLKMVEEEKEQLFTQLVEVKAELNTARSVEIPKAIKGGK